MLDKPPTRRSASVTSAELAANVRVITVRVGDLGMSDAALRNLLERADAIVRMFLEKRCAPPRHVAAVRPLSYLILQGADDPGFAADLETIRDELETYLFGEDESERLDVRAIVAPRDHVERIARREEREFIAALEGAAVAADDAAARGKVGPSLAPLQVPWHGRLALYAGYNAPKQAVVCYVVMLASDKPGGPPVLHEDVPGVLMEELSEFESAALDFAAAKVAEQLQVGPVSYCLVPVSHDTLIERRRRDDYLARVGRHHPDIARHLIPSIFGGPARPASSFVVDLAARLGKHFNLVDWRTETCALALDPFEHARLFGVTLVRRRVVNFDAELARLPSFFRKAKALRLTRGVAGVAERREVDAAVSAGVQFLSGPAISGPMDSLAPRTEIRLGGLPLA